MSTINITTTYDTATGQLRSVVTLAGFVAEVPNQSSAGERIDTADMAKGPVLDAADIGLLQISMRRAIDIANDELIEWQKVVANPEKAAALVAATAPQEPEPEPEPEPAP